LEPVIPNPRCPLKSESRKLWAKSPLHASGKPAN
jgi:hypothetical protein